MRFSRKVYLPVIGALVFGAAAAVVIASKLKLARPQSSFVEGQPAPDFTLKDQAGQPFRLADQRGSRVLLIFYRGYW